MAYALSPQCSVNAVKMLKQINSTVLMEYVLTFFTFTTWQISLTDKPKNL